MNMLEMADVTFRYPAKKGAKAAENNFAVSGISLAVEAGQCIGLVGENGSGKTTVGKLAAGLLKPEFGKVCVNNEDILGMSLGQIGARVGYLFQDPSRQLFAPTVLEDLTFPAIVNGGDANAAEEHAREMLARLGLATLEGRSVFHLSGGEKQRLALAGILLRNPAVLVLDEPTTGLDKQSCTELGNIIDGLVSDGAAVLLITHDMDFYDSHCSGKIVMNNGRITFGGTIC